MSRLRFAVRVMRPLPFPDFSYSFFAVYRRSGAREGESVTIDVDGGARSELLAVVPGREVVIVQLGLNGALRNDASPSHRT